MQETNSTEPSVTGWWQQGMDWLNENGPELLVRLGVALLILIVTAIVANVVRRLVKKAMKRTEFPELIEDFFISISGKIVWILGILMAVAQMGVQLGPLLAGLGVAGFVIGFATQDSLGNLAAGFMLLVHRPFEIGDFVEVAGVSGNVHDMKLVATTIMTPDNERIVVPNSEIWGNVIKNVTAEPERRIDFVFGIGYDDDIAKAEKVLQDILDQHPLVLDEPASTIKVHNLGDSTVDFVVRPWVKTENYWDVYWDITRAVKERFDAEEISIPYPQQDLHVRQIS